ncbi:transglycosylase SLT domain-containing protein [archaeon]|nr:transglycosylase SLT domain-containing protein [archaeon]MBL7057207.1 transglycosylase SLT domain-containing protein [Candidatus Woesearchaeota archaeon]
MMKNKKGQILPLIVVLVVIFALIALVLIHNDKSNSREVNGQKAVIGMYANAVIKSYQQQEEALIHIDNSAKIALWKSIDEINGKGGLITADCGTSGYNLWNEGTNTCWPDSENNLRIMMRDRLGVEFSKYELLSLSSNHYLTFNQKGEQLEVVGETNDKIDVVITLSGDIIEKQTQVLPTEIPADTIGRINKFHDIITRTGALHKYDPAFQKAIITQESEGYEFAVSKSGCIGIQQFCYSTARDYFDKADKKNIKSIGDCAKTRSCSLADIKKDPRSNAHKSIINAGELIEDILGKKAIKDTTDKLAFGAAAYNGGYGPIRDAIKLTGKDDPSWEEVSQYITVDVLKKYSPYKGWTDAENQAKVIEIKDYVNKVSAYYVAWGGTSMFMPSVIGTFEFGQNFRIQTPYNLSVYDKLKTFAEETIRDCKDNVAVCLEEKKVDFNNNSQDVQILDLHDCEEGNERVFYDLIENFDDCGEAWGNNCKCQITENYTSEEIKNLTGGYEARFGVDNTPRPITDKSLYINMNFTTPMELQSQFSIPDQTFWEPNTYTFWYQNKKLYNYDLNFYYSLANKKYTLKNFEKLFMVVKDKHYSLWVEFKPGAMSQILHALKNILNTAPKENLFSPTKDTTFIKDICPVAKKTFRVCGKTNYLIPTLKKTIVKNELTYEPTKIKFAMTLIDEVPPVEVQNLEVKESFEGKIELTWMDKHTEDFTMYNITYEQKNIPLSKKEIGAYYEYNAEEASPNDYNKLYYENQSDKRKYSFMIKSADLILLSNNTYVFKVVGIDNFKNQKDMVQGAELRVN